MMLTIVILLWLAASCSAKDNVLGEWDFITASDALGWTSAGGTVAFDKTDGTLTASGAECKLVSPLFDIKAAPLQYVEIELKADKSGQALIYYSNTTEEPYGGFRPGVLASFDVTGDGQFHIYRIRPFWQNQGKIIHIRIDPPGENSAVRKISIIEPQAAPASASSSWDFTGSDLGWSAIEANASVEASPTGLRITGPHGVKVMSPSLDLDAESYAWVTLRVRSDTDQTAQIQWISTGAGGMPGIPFVLKADGKPHNYAFQLSDVADWSGRIQALCIGPTMSSEPRSLVVESIKLGATPLGPPELQIGSVLLDDTYPRAGEPCKLTVEVTNVGGTAVKHVKLAARLTGSHWKTDLKHDIAELGPGRTGKIEWKVAGKTAGTAPAVCTVSADSVAPADYRTTLRFYSKLDPSIKTALKYVPEPKPADTGDYLVGCYNFPGWRDYRAWSVLNAFPERRPLLGYYNDGNPEAADWQITWALDHGIGFFIYDWYWSKGARSLEEGLHDGFLKARYNEKMKFCLLWANHNAPGTSSYDDMMNVTRFWIDNYFKRPNYLKVGGKNVMVIFSPGRFTEDMGKEEVRRAFADANKMCEDAGVGGLYWVACGWYDQQAVQTLEYEGYSALSGYNYPGAGERGQWWAPYSWMVDGYRDIWEDLAGKAAIPYIPLCEPGWDSRPWHGLQARVRLGKTVELWQKMLSNAKAFADDPKHKTPEGKKLVFLEAWNEYGEGDYIEPHRQFGFDYLEAIRQVFAPRSKPPLIVLPKDIGLGPYDIPKPPVVTSWEFSDPNARTWTCENATVSYPSGVLHADITSSDPRFSTPPVEIDASKLKTLEVKMKSDSADDAQFFFAGGRSGLSENKSVKFAVKGDNQFHVYTVDLAANELWRGTITSLRFDPCSTPGAKVEIAYIKVK